MTRYASNDVPVTDAELEQIWGPEGRPETHAKVCRAIREIHYNDMEPDTVRAIIAALSAKMAECPFTKDMEDVIELLDAAHDSV